ncbi:hypothetical protein G6M26_22725 [Agrobacterium tumefaciens]|nr:hypothetical protein [Agrobacterium tumefaciens]NTE21356.1 hypothetical protein [Agrobacterium tumefaciens]
MGGVKGNFVSLTNFTVPEFFLTGEVLPRFWPLKLRKFVHPTYKVLMDGVNGNFVSLANFTVPE